MYALASENPQIAKLVKLGTTLKGREILALKLTQGARGQTDGSRPGGALQRHPARARVDRHRGRPAPDVLVHRRAGATTTRTIKDLLKDDRAVVRPGHEPGRLPVHVRRTSGCGARTCATTTATARSTIGDGVDPNRNYPEHWSYDEEGSSSILSSETYRGPAPASEPETQAMMGLLAPRRLRVPGQLPLQRPLAAVPGGLADRLADGRRPDLLRAVGQPRPAGDRGLPPGPELGRPLRHQRRGERLRARAGRRAGVDAGAEPGLPGCGFVFPDDEALVQEEFERNLPFARRSPNSAADPDDPKSSLGIKTKPFYLKSDDPYKDGHPRRELHVQVLLRRPAAGAGAGQAQPRRGDAQVPDQRRRGAQRPDVGVDGRREVQARPSEYHVMRGTVTGTKPGDTVEVWFEGGGQKSESFTYRTVSESTTACSSWRPRTTRARRPCRRPARTTSTYYLDALAANGIQADVYDVDASGRTAPDDLGVLSHYNGVIWYTGDDIVTREAGPRRAATRTGSRSTRCSRCAPTWTRAAGWSTPGRPGRPAVHGRRVGTQFYDPKDEGRVQHPARPTGTRGAACCCAAPGDGINDVLQYWFGGIPRRSPATGTTRRQPVRRQRHRRPVRRAVLGLRRRRQARATRTHVVVRRRPAACCRRSEYPAVRERGLAPLGQAGRAVRPAHRRASTSYSQIADVSLQAADA